MQAAIDMEPTAAPRPADLERLFRDHHGLVFRAAYRVTGNASDAEDVLQTVFLRLVRREANCDALENAEAYLHRAAVNAALDLLRSRQTAAQTPLEDAHPAALRDSAPDPGRQHASTELKRWLRAAVSRLHPTAAAMFALRYFEGLENPEIAARMNTTQSTVAVTLHRARTRMQQEYRAQMEQRHA